MDNIKKNQLIHQFFNNLQIKKIIIPNKNFQTKMQMIVNNNLWKWFNKENIKRKCNKK